MNRMTFVLWAVLAALLAACGSAKPTPPPLMELSLTATDIAYDTHQFDVVAGQPVRLTLHNEGALIHDFSIQKMPHSGEVMAEEADHGMEGHDMNTAGPDPEIHVASPVGESLSVTFTPITPGDYEFFCTVVGHKEAGMVGTLVVSAPKR